LGDQVALLVIDELLQQRRTETVGDAAEGHAPDDMRIDHDTAVVADDITLDFRLAEIGINRQQHQVKLEGVTRIHLHATVFR
jgi:hypothetical protein